MSSSFLLADRYVRIRNLTTDLFLKTLRLSIFHLVASDICSERPGMLDYHRLCDFGGCAHKASRILHVRFLIDRNAIDTYQYCVKHLEIVNSISSRPVANEHQVGETCVFCRRLTPLTEEDFEEIKKEEEGRWSDLI